MDKQGYNNIRGIYKKYYPEASDESVESEAYRLLDNVRFQQAKEEVWSLVNTEKLDLAKEVMLVLRNKMFQSKKENDAITAAIALGKFVMGEKSEITQVDKNDNQFSLDRLSHINQNKN